MRTDSVYQVIRNDERFSILAEILARTGIGDVLTTERTVFTFFAPTDAALSALPKSVLRLLTSADGTEMAEAILARHLVEGSYLYSDDLQGCDHVTPLNGGKVKISVENNALRFGRAPIRTPGIAARNGVVFPVDSVLRSRRRGRGA